MQVLASTPQTHTCYAKKLASYGLQRDVVAERHAAADRADVGQHGVRTDSVKQLIIELVRSDAFRTHAEVPQ